MRYTPGNWIVDTEKSGIVRMNEYLRCEQTATAENLPEGMTMELLQDEGDANAKLIAAAPKMLAALELISPIVDALINQTPSGLERIKLCDINILIKTAIDKATK